MALVSCQGKRGEVVNKKYETIADICYRVRYGDAIASQEDRERLARQIKNTHKREAQRLVADASKGFGYGAKMREALESAMWFVEYMKDKVVNGYLSDNIEVVHRCQAALAAPPRNCDVGTVDEQYKRFKHWCNKSKDFSCHVSMCAYCFAKWAQMPHQEGEENGN